ncbi:hypothetical protein [Streptomyces sp. NPDC058644]|uniref:hypothetical protein n=1 Tax=unclassified Streptomyces TaxID=2593676 RepID=UPI0036481122
MARRETIRCLKRHVVREILAEGKTRREIIRCLKRYVAREIYRLIATSRQEFVNGSSRRLAP